MSIKLERLEHEFVEKISNILKTEVRDKKLSFITVMEVRITPDLESAKVYVTTLNDDERDSVINSLNKASKFIEKKLCERVEIRKMPELTFVYDESLEYGNKIEGIIEKISKED